MSEFSELPIRYIVTQVAYIRGEDPWSMPTDYVLNSPAHIFDTEDEAVAYANSTGSSNLWCVIQPVRLVTNSVPWGSTPPTDPQNLVVEVSGSSVTLTWDLPAWNGGAALTGYLFNGPGYLPSEMDSLNQLDPSLTTVTYTGIASGSYSGFMTANNVVGASPGVPFSFTIA